MAQPLHTDADMVHPRLSRPRSLALVLASALTVGQLGACSSHSEPPPPVDDTVQRGAAGAPAAPHEGMSTRNKVVVLAGAAALYYLYKHHKAAAQDGPDGQYYLSKNGRVYYRDADHRAHWVTAPSAGVAVPAAEATEYEGIQGYDNRTTGRDLVGMGSDPE